MKKLYAIPCCILLNAELLKEDVKAHLLMNDSSRACPIGYHDCDTYNDGQCSGGYTTCGAVYF